MTRDFREGVSSSHKPYIRPPEAIQNPNMQEKLPVCLGMTIPSKDDETYLFKGQISPEHTGILKQSIA
jgi:hypothetical protein